MEVIGSIVFIGGLSILLTFSIYYLVFLPIGFIAESIRNRLLKNSMPKRKWRWRRIRCAFSMFWSALFGHLLKWQRISLVTSGWLAIIIAVLVWIGGSLYNDSEEALSIHDLRAARFDWMLDGCPQPPDLEREMGLESGYRTNYIYNGKLTLKDSSYHGLFAEKNLT